MEEEEEERSAELRSSEIMGSAFSTLESESVPKEESKSVFIPEEADSYLNLLMLAKKGEKKDAKRTIYRQGFVFLCLNILS